MRVGDPIPPAVPAHVVPPDSPTARWAWDLRIALEYLPQAPYLWDDPDHFVPERFLPENAGARQRYSYVPFSVGPRVCAGQAFGLTEAILCLAALAQRTRLRLAPEAVVEPVCRLTLRPGDSLPMLVEHRG